VLHAELAVDQEGGVEPRVAVCVGGERLVVPRERVLEHRPRRPRGREAALRRASGEDLLRGLTHLPPRGRRPVGEARLLEGVAVHVEDRARRVERHRVEVAVLRVVAGHGLDEVVPVDRDLLLSCELEDRVDRSRQQHGLRADVEDLDDVRWVLLPVRGDRSGEDLGVGPFVERFHLVLRLALVELPHQLVRGLAELSAHRVPEMDFGLRRRRRGRGEKDRRGQDADDAGRAFHASLRDRRRYG